MRVVVLSLLLIGVVAVVFTAAADRPEGCWFATRSVTVARHGMVAAAHPLAVQVGIDVLKRGGGAVDAAIAVNAALGLMEPVSAGLGGDLFAMVWDPTKGKLVGLNGSGRAPLALTPAKVPAQTDGTIPPYSPYSWTVPGCADAWFDLHTRFGRLPMKDLLAPTIAYAQEGVPVPQVIAGSWARSVAQFKDTPGFAEVFLAGGNAPAEGEPFANPALARTLEILAAEGRDAYYRGRIAEKIVAYSKRVGGFFAMDDFARHTSEWQEPISTTYRGVTVWELPPNGQRLAALEMLNILERFDLKALGRDNPDFWQIMVEAKKLAFADRARCYADPAFFPAPLAALLDKGYAAKQAARIDMRRAARSVEPGNPALRHGDTTFLVTADDRGMMVALIQSNYTGFGSGYVVPELGFGLQDRGRPVLARGRPPQRPRPRQAAVSHDHPGVPREGREAADGVRCLGRRHAAAGPRPDRGQRRGLRHEPAGSRGRAALLPHRGLGAHRHGDDQRRDPEPGAQRPRGGAPGTAAARPQARRGERQRLRRLPGGLARSCDRRLLRRERVPQGRLRDGLLRRMNTSMRDLFLLRPGVVYLNHGSFGACPRPVFDRYQAWQRALEAAPVEFLGRRFAELMRGARGALAAFVGADPDDLVFVPNVTTGLNAVARSRRLEPGDGVEAGGDVGHEHE